MRAFLLALLAPFAANATCPDPALMIDRPFAAKDAVSNFMECVSIDSKTAELLPRVQRICYSAGEVTPGCQPGSSTCKPGSTHFRGQRDLYLNVDDFVSHKGVEASLRRLEKDGCDKFHLQNLRGNVDRRSANYQYSFHMKDRMCDDILGTHDLCEGDMDGALTVSLDDQLTMISTARRTGDSGRCLGIIPTNMDSTLSRSLFGGVEAFQAALFVDMVMKHLVKIPDGIFAPVTLKFGSGTIPNLEVTNMPYTNDAELSGFEPLDETYVTYIHQFGYLEGFARKTYLNERRSEIEFLRRLSKNSADDHVVKRGDTLSAMAKDTYGDERLFLLIDHYNGLRGRDIRIGETIKVPQPHQACKLLRENQAVVSKGQSVWQKARDGQIGAPMKDSEVYSGNADTIYPFEVLTPLQTKVEPEQP